MPADSFALPLVQIGPGAKRHLPLALGGSIFPDSDRTPETEAGLLATMETALAVGITHFDTASGYGQGRSETLIGQFLQDRREQVFLASKASIDEMDAQLMLRAVEASLARLQTDFIDLYYIHWPRSGKDMRPVMEGLELARDQGKIGAIGVSNFSVAQMQQVAEVGAIDAHQLCYNLLWRFPEREIIPYCREHRIAVVTYSSIAQGVLTGKFGRDPHLGAKDQRARTVHFEPEVWPHVYAAVEQLKQVAQTAGRTLPHLAIRWVLRQPGITTVVVGARRSEQVEENVQALAGEIPAAVFDEMTAITDKVMPFVPDVGNPYRYNP
jgi:aryl-alcohol dehydrogenase-like predicted oxidoreductase